MQGREPPQTTRAAGEVEILEAVDEAKASKSCENRTADKDCLVAKEPADRAIAKFGQEAGAFQKKGRRIKAPRKPSTDEGFLEGSLDPVERGGRENRVRVQEEQNFAVGLLGAKIQLGSALADM